MKKIVTAVGFLFIFVSVSVSANNDIYDIKLSGRFEVYSNKSKKEICQVKTITKGSPEYSYLLENNLRNIGTPDSHVIHVKCVKTYSVGLAFFRPTFSNSPAGVMFDNHEAEFITKVLKFQNDELILEHTVNMEKTQVLHIKKLSKTN